MSETIKFYIKTLDEYTRMPIADVKLQLQNINLGQEAFTDSQGLASFEIDSQESLKSFRAKLIYKDYQEYPVSDRSIIPNSIKRREKPFELRFKKKLDNFAVQKIELEPNKYELKDANNEIVTKNFYKAGDTLTFKANFDENKAKENEIKWAYKVINLGEIQILQRQDSKDKNSQSTQIHPFQLDEIPNDTLQILQDSTNKAYFSKTPAYTIKNIKFDELEPENIYKGKTLEIILPQDFANKQIAIFAYKNEPNWKVCQIIRLNDYPQITIDCTLAETLRANAKNDEVSRLGWGVSYICQRLWHDNPSDAKEIGELIYTDSRQQEFIDSIPNETMKKIVKEVLPRVEMGEFAKDIAKECPKIKSQLQKSAKKNLRFYVELDWDEFYLKFPLMKELEGEILKTLEFNHLNDWARNNFLNSKFYNLFMNWINLKSQHNALKEAIVSNQAEMIVNFANIYNGKTKNKDVFSLNNKDTNENNPYKEQSLSKVDKPYKLWGNHFYSYGIKDLDFAMKGARDMDKMVALYALTGKFNLYYIPSLFKITQGKSNRIDIQILEIKAYIFDGFDFIIEKPEDANQFVGSWNYENMEFIISKSSREVFREFIGSTKIVSIDNVKQLNENRMFNQDYNNTQNYFNLGCDFRILTSSFKDIEVYPLSMPISVRID